MSEKKGGWQEEKGRMGLGVREERMEKKEGRERQGKRRYENRGKDERTEDEGKAGGWTIRSRRWFRLLI